MTSKKKKTEQGIPLKNTKRFLPLIALLGVMIVGLVVGAGILWEKRLELLVGVDLPHEDQETSEASSIIPYICNKDPEACEKGPLTFRGKDEIAKDKPKAGREEGAISAKENGEGKHEETEAALPTIAYPEPVQPKGKEEQGILEALRTLPILQKMESRLEAIDEIRPLQQKVETLSIWVLLDGVKKGEISFELLVRALRNSKSTELKAMAVQFPTNGKLVPFSELKVYGLADSTDKGTSQKNSMWDDIVNWGSSLVDVKTEEDIKVGQIAENFKVAAKSGQYDLAFSLYEKMALDQRQAYGDWISEIRKRKKLQVIDTLVLQQLAEGM